MKNSVIGPLSLLLVLIHNSYYAYSELYLSCESTKPLKFSAQSQILIRKVGWERKKTKKEIQYFTKLIPLYFIVNVGPAPVLHHSN